MLNIYILNINSTEPVISSLVFHKVLYILWHPLKNPSCVLFLFYSIGIFVETESTIRDRQSSGRPSWNKRGCLNILSYLHRISVFYKPAAASLVVIGPLCIARTLEWLGLTLRRLFSERKAAVATEWRSSFFLLVDLALRDYKNFFISLAVLRSLGTCPPFLRSFAQLEVHRFTFFWESCLFSFCILARFPRLLIISKHSFT